MTNPQNSRDWKSAANAAYILLLLADSSQYGMFSGLKVNRVRCEEILAKAKNRGIYPRELVNPAEMLIALGGETD